MSRFPQAAYCGAALALGVLAGCGDVPLDVVVSQSASGNGDGLLGGSAGALPTRTGGDAGSEPAATGTGGGGGTNQSSTSSGGTSSQTSPDVPASAACEPYADWDETWTALEEEALALINERRISGASCPGHRQTVRIGHQARATESVHSQKTGGPFSQG